MGEHSGHGVHFVMVEEKRNILVGYDKTSLLHILLTVHVRLGIFVGFATFFVMEKTLRVLGGEEGHSHSHSHAHSDDHAALESKSNGASTAVAALDEDGLRARKSNGVAEEKEHAHEHGHGEGKGPSKLSAYLNLFGDFVHNITDGLACVTFPPYVPSLYLR